MKNKYKTKNNRKYFKRRNHTLKLYGGDEPVIEGNISTEKDPSAQKLLEEVKKERELPSINSSELLGKVEDLAEGVGVNAIENIGNLVGVDLTNPEATRLKLDEIKETLTNPENVEKIKEVAGNVAEVGAVALEASKPFIDPLINETIEKGSEAASKIGENSVKILLNTAEEIPGVGILIGTARSLSNAGEAIMATTNAASEIMTSASDSVNASTKNFKKLIQTKGDLLQRTQKSIADFTNPMKNMKSPITNPMKNIKSPITNKNSVGGTRKLGKKHKHKSRRVRFI